ncbi:MAG: Mo-dependent nitrogenase C-terminal domain-containing protein [Thermostichales cyanobacterium BF4_bins_65]
METLTGHRGEQAQLWLRSLLTMAWADGHYDPEEKALIESLLQEDLKTLGSPTSLEPITPAEVAERLDPQEAENLLRVLVMVGLADGVYSASEAELVQAFAQALGVEIPGFAALQTTVVAPGQPSPPPSVEKSAEKHDFLDPLRHWLDGVEVKNPKVARFLCRMIPAQCPFERDVVLFNRKIFHIPPMCKLNPLYDQVVGLRFRALNYLAEECKEDVRPYL